MAASDGAVNPGPSTSLGCPPTRQPSWSWRVGDDSWGGSCFRQTRAVDPPGPSAWSPQPWPLKSAPPLLLTATRVPPNEPIQDLAALRKISELCGCNCLLTDRPG